jgi:hypothetical protein
MNWKNDKKKSDTSKREVYKLPQGVKSKDVANNKRPPSPKQRPLRADDLTEFKGQETRRDIAMMYPNDILPHDYVKPEDHDPIETYAEITRSNGGKIDKNPASVNWRSLAELCKIQCTRDEIFAIIGMHEIELNNRCHVIYGMSWIEFRTKHQTDGKASLRRKMIEKAYANDGDTPMLKHLSAHYLGMTAQSESEATQPPTNIIINFADLKRMKKDQSDV